MLFFFLIASAYKAYAVPIPLGPEVFSSTPFTFLFGRSPCNCGPQERTLFEVIRGCVLTIFACVYTSLHPNITDPKASTMQKILRRLKMAFYMLIAPEAVIWWAFRQWYGAREIARVVNNAKPDLKWTTTHGHFVQMGGLLGIFPDGHRELIDLFHIYSGISGGTIDPNELRFPKDQVEDRSKGDFLSKGLVALQTSWFVLECIARLQQQLPITELEVVTLAFAVLNIITYGVWWDKPLNVNCQVKLHVKHGYADQSDELQEARGGGDEIEDIQGGQDLVLTDIGRRRESGGDGDQAVTSPLIQEHRKEHVGFRQRVVVRPFLALVLPIRDMFTCENVEKGASHVPMFYARYLGYNPLFRIRLITCLIGMIFGGIHFIAWHSHFPTHLELILWRSSSLVIVVVPFLVALFGVLAGEREWEFRCIVPVFEWSFKCLFVVLQLILFTLGPILYILARLSLIVQAFLSLRDLRPEVFQTVTWTSYIPHL